MQYIMVSRNPQKSSMLSSVDNHYSKNTLVFKKHHKFTTILGTSYTQRFYMSILPKQIPHKHMISSVDSKCGENPK